MRSPRGLRRRIVVAFAVFAAVLVAVMVFSFDAVYHVTEDIVLERQLEVEADHLLESPELFDRAVAEVGRNITAFVGLSAVPPDLREWLAGLEPGSHEHLDFANPLVDDEIHCVVREIEGRSEQLYVVFDATRLVTGRQMEGVVYLIAIAISLLIVGVVGAGVGRILADVVVRPVSSLADELGAGSLETIADRIDPDEFGDDVGVLARALADAAERLRGFVVRERRFTANASHELRTPVAVIRGAAEVMERRVGDDPSLSKPLERIHRAAAAMEETIELFLALAREGELETPENGCLLGEVVDEAVEGNRRYVDGKPVAVSVDVPASARVDAPPRALAVVLGNLVGNAFRRTEQGTVVVRWRDERIEVVDTGPGIPEELGEQATGRYVTTGSGHGLGLDIVNALCQRFGWRLELTSAEGAGTYAALSL